MNGTRCDTFQTTFFIDRSLFSFGVWKSLHHLVFLSFLHSLSNNCSVSCICCCSNMEEEEEEEKKKKKKNQEQEKVEGEENETRGTEL